MNDIQPSPASQPSQPASSPQPAQPTQPSQPVEPPKKSKKGLISFILVFLALLALAAGYFIALPTWQVGEVKKTEPTHKSVNDKLVRVYDSFTLDEFTKTDVEVGKGKSDVKIGLDAVKDAKAALASNAATLTKFSAYPLLGWNAKYANATTLDSKEAKYIEDARKYLDDYQKFLEYYDKGLDLQAKSEAASKKIDNISDTDTPVQIATKIDASAAELQALINEAKAMDVPDFVKEQHLQEIEMIQKLQTAFKSMSDAARKLDIAKLVAIQADLAKISADGDTLAQSGITKLHRDSLLQKHIDSLKSMNTQIVELYGKL